MYIIHLSGYYSRETKLETIEDHIFFNAIFRLEHFFFLNLNFKITFITLKICLRLKIEKLSF